MKTTILLIIVSALLFSCNGPTKEKQENQDQTNPAEANFKSQYPDAKDVEWEQEGEYTEAEFEQDGLEISILYDKDGNVIETETEIDASQLPPSVSNYLTENYAGSEIEEAEKIESPKGNFFEVEIEYENDEEVELLFDASGNFVEVVIEKDVDEGEEDDEGEKEEEENEVEIEISELPEGVTKYVNQNYADYTITEAEKETTEAGVFFEVELKNADGMEMDLVFDEEGNFVGIEEEE